MVWFADNIFAAELPVMTRLQCCDGAVLHWLLGI